MMESNVELVLKNNSLGRLSIGEINRAFQHLFCRRYIFYVIIFDIHFISSPIFINIYIYSSE